VDRVTYRRRIQIRHSLRKFEDRKAKRGEEERKRKETIQNKGWKEEGKISKKRKNLIGSGERFSFLTS